ncbi:hypothetical protein ACFLY0_00865 [Patescibacteria group bacterium]
MSKEGYCSGLKHMDNPGPHHKLGEKCTDDETSVESSEDETGDFADNNPDEIINTDIPYEHHCHGTYEGVIYLADKAHEICPTCKGILGENGCDLQKK